MSIGAQIASTADYTLRIYGNANLDDTINDMDVAFVRDVIKGTKAPTCLADANHDGNIDEMDIAQIEQIIAGTNNEIIIIDSSNRTVTVDLPVKSIAVCGTEKAVALRILGSMDRAVGVAESIVVKDYARRFFPEIQGLPTIGDMEIDYEAVLSLKPDIILTYSVQNVEDEKLPGIVVLNFDFYRARNIFQEMKTLGYILGREDRAQKYIDFCKPILQDIETKLTSIPSNERTRVYLEGQGDYKTQNEMGAASYQIKLAGGINIAADMFGGATGGLEVDREWVVENNPDIIVKMTGWNRDGTCAGYETDDFKSMAEMRERILKRSELAGINAIENERVEMLAYDITYNPDFIISIVYLAKLFYPELFRDLDPTVVHQEYLDAFHDKLNWSVRKNGAFVYPLI
ncbi:MAG TPA: ABC transporter substrate-binding protein [Methanotrichaceae archaeon]|nr:ABC transporter substrate-binding protein [Methanotrichaceae archaeon]